MINEGYVVLCPNDKAEDGFLFTTIKSAIKWRDIFNDWEENTQKAEIWLIEFPNYSGIKRCTKCSLEKGKTEFDECDTHDGLHYWCKSCVNEDSSVLIITNKKNCGIKDKDYGRRVLIKDVSLKRKIEGEEVGKD